MDLTSQISFGGPASKLRHSEGGDLTLPSVSHTSLQLDAEALKLLHKFALASLRVRDMSTEGFRLDSVEVYSGCARISAAIE